jgi:hypothetical protein
MQFFFCEGGKINCVLGIGQLKNHLQKKLGGRRLRQAIVVLDGYISKVVRIRIEIPVANVLQATGIFT